MNINYKRIKMEKTITLSLEEYNELLTYKDAFDNKKTFYTNIWSANIFFYTENEAIEKLLESLKQLEADNKIIREFSIQFEIEAKVLSSKIKKFENLPWYKRISYKFSYIL